MAHDDAIGAVQPCGVLLGRQPQSGQQVLSLVGLAVAIGIPQRGQERRMHHVQDAVVVGESLDRVELVGKDRGLVGIAVAVGALNQPDLVATHDLAA